jgi:hypothetical protein
MTKQPRVRSGAAAVRQDSSVGATGLFEQVAEDRQPIESAFLVERPTPPRVLQQPRMSQAGAGEQPQRTVGGPAAQEIQHRPGVGAGEPG